MIIFFYGQDSFRIKQKLIELKNKFKKTVDKGSFSLTEINGEKTNIAELSEKINSDSLFAQKKMIIIKNIFKNKDINIFNPLLTIVKNQTKNTKTVLVFIDEEIDKKLNEEVKKLFIFLKKQDYSQEFNLLTDNQLNNFAKAEFEKREQKISPTALRLLLTKTGNDLWRLNNEINKLSALAFKREINEEDVEENVLGQFEEKIFILIDSFFNKNKDLAYKTLNEQLSAGLSPDYILNMLTRQIKILIEIKSAQKNTSNEKLATALNLHPFVIKKSLNQVNQFNLIDIKKAFKYLVNLDYNNKQGKVNLKDELFFLAAQGLLF